MGLVGTAVHKATIDIGNRVENEIQKLTIITVPDEFDVFLAKEGHSGILLIYYLLVCVI